ncbi:MULTISPECIES: LytR/AlgR family response regulator transcription factor [Bacteroides]|uniref:LytR/AlgR family response regulator transcription factor n=1 Tax=Bacteroides TaxID=816 RepID=UPI002648928F|nr:MULTISPECIES: LytTR family DNA-binding domain-containing protein [Bacteroides]
MTQTTPQYLFLNSRDEFLRIDISNIAYFEADGNYTNIVSVNRLKGVVCTNLAQMQKYLSDKLREDASIFARVGKKYIINLRYVYSINTLRQQVILSDGASFSYQLTIGKEALKELKQIFIENFLKQ